MQEIPEYWTNPLQNIFNIDITEIQTNHLIFVGTQKLFHGGGGQLPDKAEIKLPNYSTPINIEKILPKSYEINFPSSWDLPNLPFNVEVEFNLNYRKMLMRAHSTQHLLSVVLLKEYEIRTEKAEIKPDSVHMYLDTTVDLKNIPDLTQRIYSYIYEPVPITSHILSKDKSEDINGQLIDISKIRGHLPKDSDWIRLVSIDNGHIDLNTCGGTHLANTQLIQDFFITDLKKKELQFVCGLKALALRTDLAQNMILLSRTTNLSLDQLFPFINQRLIDYTILKKTHSNAIQQNLLQILNLLKNQINQNDIEKSLRSLSEFNPDGPFISGFLKFNIYFTFFDTPYANRKIWVNIFSKTFTNSQISIIVVAVIEHLNLLIFNTKKDNKINAKSIIDLLKTELNIKGGGSTTVAQVDIKSIENPLQTIINLIKEKLNI